jgi:hypothetical protein
MADDLLVTADAADDGTLMTADADQSAIVVTNGPEQGSHKNPWRPFFLLFEKKK